MTVPRLLVVDDDRAFRLSVAEILRQEGYAVDVAADAREAVDRLSAAQYALVLLDLRMPGLDGISLAEVLRQRGEGVPILMISGAAEVSDAVRALHTGVDDFITKPVEPDVLVGRVAQLLARRPSGGEGVANIPGVIGRSSAMRTVLDAVARVAPTQSTVLLTGETGTGKELIARAIHDLSARRSAPFVAVNTGALAEGLLESELFGHVRGAFTGAVRDKAGFFEAATGGTIFLDEVGDMSAAVQHRLLRVLQEREITHVGSTTPTRVDVRVVAATNRDLRALMASGRFREDLFYRLNVFPIALPPLRERAEDIPLLVDFFLTKPTTRHADGRALTVSPLAMRMLQTYSWPGNVRELASVIESASIRADGDRLEAQDLPEEIRRHSGIDDTGIERYHSDSTDADERRRIEAALAQAGGVRSEAASLLGMGRTTLWRKMRKYGLADDEGGAGT